MSFQTAVFYLFAAILVFAALRVISVKSPVHAALWLVLSFFTAAAIWLLLHKTAFGRVVRAGIQRPDMVASLGIKLEPYMVAIVTAVTLFRRDTGLPWRGLWRGDNAAPARRP